MRPLKKPKRLLKGSPADQVDPVDSVDPHNALKLMDPDNGPKLVDPADPGVLIFHINHILHHLNPCKHNDIKHNIYKYHDINPCKLQQDNLQPP